METKERTNVQRARAHLRTQQHQVINLSGLSEADYNAFQYEIGMQVLEAHMVDHKSARKLSGSKKYWNYLKMQWRNHEKVVIQFLVQKGEFKVQEYQSKMQEMVESKRTALTLRQFLTIFKP